MTDQYDISNLIPYQREDMADFRDSIVPKTIHRRVELTSTVKEGMRVAEVTVSLDGEYDASAVAEDMAIIEKELLALYAVGTMVAGRINRENPPPSPVKVKGE